MQNKSLTILRNLNLSLISFYIRNYFVLWKNFTDRLNLNIHTLIHIELCIFIIL